jgi:hypothetical protein
MSNLEWCPEYLALLNQGAVNMGNAMIKDIGLSSPRNTVYHPIEGVNYER